MRRDQARSVELDFAVLADHAELHREPEEPSHAVQIFLAGEAGADLPVALQGSRRIQVCVHRHMTEDIMKDVRLRCVLERLAGAQRRGVVGKRRAAIISKNAGPGR